MSRLVVVSALGVYLATVSLALAVEPDAKGIEFFEKKIRPVLVDQCYKCHSDSANKLKGGLRLDTSAGTRQGGETGPAIVPGSPDDSLLIEAIRHEGLEMPPEKKLPDSVIADFEAWIKMGAPDPRVADGGGQYVKREIDIEEGRKFWAFQPALKTDPPKVKDNQWPRSDIDRFVLAAIEQQNLKPVRDASPVELVRRIHFDLIGLPPSPEEVDHFVESAIHNPQAAIEELVDRLLDSPQFGERWGRHWLDIARYAESNGNADNTPFPHAWRYRDYVIESFNEDKPYDQFITEQLAGDLLPFDSPQQRNEQLIATGFLALGSKPRAQNNPNFQMDVVAEQIEVTTSAMLGITVACARCHDHKFDPIPTAEYYSLAGIFNSSRTLYGTGGNKSNKKQPSSGGLLELLAEDQQSAKDLARQQEQLTQLTTRQREITAQLGKSGATDNSKGTDKKRDAQIRKLQTQLARLKSTGNDRTKIDRIQEQLTKLGVAPDESPDENSADPVGKDEVKLLQSELAKIESEIQSLNAKKPGAAGMAMGVMEGSPNDCAICIRGESTDRADIVPRGFISVVTTSEPPKIDSKSSGRLELARWIASPQNPLTARVAVNRIWHHLFGRGIVSSMDNFGQLGERPTHPELLDWLAIQFVEEGCSVKQMIRTIVLSRAYQMSSTHDVANYAKDPDNVWLWRMSPRRLDAESLRDAILAFSGQLDLSRPGASELPDYNKKQPPQVRADSKHRSVYLPIVRNGEPESLTLFDFADPSIVVGDREETTVPAQSLYLMNNPFVVEQSRSAAQRLLEQKDLDDAARVDLAYVMAFARRPTDEQRERAVIFVNTLSEKLTASEPNAERGQIAAWAGFCQSLIASAEFRYLD